MLFDKGLSFLRQASSKWQVLSPVLSALAPSKYEVDPVAACSALRNVSLPNLNTTILATSYFHNATAVDTLGTCKAVAQISEPLCRVRFVVNTSSISAITAEAWLPTSWNGRFLALGNGGLGGCIDYENLEYGSSLGFASVASNNGHDGMSGAAFANNTEVLADFTSRSIHTETIVGKALVNAHYERAQSHSYYKGCSTGGRQGIYAALHFPSDFDGVLAGAPALNFNHLIGWSAMVTKHIGAPDGENSPSFIPPQLWDTIAAEVLKQCDSLDGVMDGIITEPDACEFLPEELLCEGRRTKDCLTRLQVEALRRIYAPLHGQNGEFLYPRFDPGAESSPLSRMLFSGRPFAYSDDWMKYVVHNDPLFNYSQIGLADIVQAEALNPGNISTFSGDLSAFHAQGGKLITYHGRADFVIPSGISKSFYNLVSRTLDARSSSLDKFYRLFLVPGMGHCGYGGRGAIHFGRGARSTVPKTEQKDSFGSANGPQDVLTEDHQQPTDLLLALVDWTERGQAPEHIIGISDDGKTARAHCRYPSKSQWAGDRWVCI